MGRNRETLPVFALRPGPANEESIASLAAAFFDADATPEGACQPAAGVTRFRYPAGTVDVDTRTGSVWIAHDRLWRLPDIAPGAVGTMPESAPPARSDRFSTMVRALERPLDGIRVRADPAWSDGARLVIWERPGWTRTNRFLDRTDGYTVSLDAPDHDLDSIPITGSGAVLTTRSGPRGEPLGFHAAIPRLSGLRVELPVVDRLTADAQVREGLGEYDDVLLDAALTYRVVQTADGPCLCPHWVYEVVVRLEGRYLRIASPCIPAVEIDLVEPAHSSGPRAGIDDDQVDWGPPSPGPRFLLSWLGEDAGRITLSRAIRDAVIAALEQAGWRCRDFGERAAIEAHWHRLAAGAIRQADLAAYIGHAAEYGMKFNPPDSAWLESHVCRFGGRLKWVIVDACGPLQDEAAAGRSSAFDLWARSFQGLRALLGFATAQEQNDRQFPRAIEYALGGQPLARAWFQAACECQGTLSNHGKPAWVAGLFAVDGAATTIEDRLADVHWMPPLEEPDRLAGVWIPLG